MAGAAHLNVRHRMHNFRQICASLVLVAGAVTTFAQANEFPSPEAAVAVLLPNAKFVQWESADGDFNGDGVNDRAMLLAEMDGPVDKQREIRLVVLAGLSGGKYAALSVSSRYCSAQKFYNLKADGASLFATEVHKAEGDALITNTLQFRFNKKHADFELIGKENIWESGNEYGRISINYLAGKFIRYERVRGHIRVKEEKRFKVPRPARLNGFDCDRYFDGMPY